MELTTRVLHDYPQYMEECADILNEEWPRSKAARLHSLQKSNEKFPVCLVLVNKEKGEELLLGHSKLSIVYGKESCCLIESVCVRKKLRGKGYGRVIMQESEKYATSRGYHTMYLTTHDKQDFYKHLNYTFCEAVISFGADPKLIPEHLIKQLTAATLRPQEKERESSDKQNSIILPPPAKSTQDGPSPKSSTAPPCPPLTHSTAPLAPPNLTVPPPPPPPPQPISQDKTSNQGKPEIVKWDPRHISWMRKDLS
ncbi:N-alpha-acetyltransferase 80-like [Pecten maximus]|uniref:N-alpha-acetyltransferase 80-like n=1 Tax=Pecten maximus TaxID=6579 RepID=UPI0014589EC2|nr:N-alpha-acetyltransferase 80-like [Pecten maximus]